MKLYNIDLYWSSLIIFLNTIFYCFDAGGSSSLIPEAEMVERPPYHFQCFIDRTIQTEINSICRLLGYYGNLNILLDHFMELFVQTAAYRKQAAYCMNEIIAGLYSPPTFVSQTVGKPQRYEIAELDSMVRYAST